ncbi:MAG: pilus assembly protein TadG-related protein [Thermoguttaceae bacterium]
MKRQRDTRGQRRRGSILILVALAAIPLMGMVAFAVDYGYLLKARTDLQRGADAAALAGVLSLQPDAYANQDLAAVREAVRSYASANVGSSFTVPDSDIVIGRFEPSTVYTNLQILSTGICDTVRVTLRRDGTTNSRAPLFFARALGFGEASITVTATAALQKAVGLKAGTHILPFAVPETEWNSLATGAAWKIYGDGKITDSTGQTIPGNWGTIDVGSHNNSTDALNQQILNGITQSDVDALYSYGTIPNNTHIGAFDAMWLDADSGLSIGLKQSIDQVIGQQRLVPIYDSIVDAGGDNMQAHIVNWGVVTVTAAKFTGTVKTYIQVTKSYMYDGDLFVQSDLSNDTDVIENAFAAPVLLE